MTRSEIKDAFRVQNPQMTANVISDTALNSFLLVGDKEVCAKTKCIVGDYTWTCADDEQYWDLTNKIPTFMAIDDFPGGGVIFDNDPLDPITIAQLDRKCSSWRTRSSGTPDYYFTRGKMLWFDRPVATGADIQVYYIAISDDFSSDDISPFNQLTYLEPYHNALVMYLTMKAKSKFGKPEEAAIAKNEFDEYVAWMKKEVNSSKKGIVYYAP